MSVFFCIDILQYPQFIYISTVLSMNDNDIYCKIKHQCKYTPLHGIIISAYYAILSINKVYVMSRERK